MPGCPDFAFSTASTASILSVVMESRSWSQDPNGSVIGGDSSAGLRRDADTHRRLLGDGDRIVVGVAGGAEAFRPARRPGHPFERQVAEGVGLDEAADLLDRVGRGDELLAARG